MVHPSCAGARHIRRERETLVIGSHGLGLMDETGAGQENETFYLCFCASRDVSGKTCMQLVQILQNENQR